MLEKAFIRCNDAVTPEFLLFLKAVNFLFYGVSSNEFIAEDCFGLTDAVAAVYSLLFYSRIPPGSAKNT
jgi:hypothetical protein